MMPMKTNTETGQWNQILCGLVKTLIRIRKPEIGSMATTGRGRFVNRSETEFIHVDGSFRSRIRCASDSDVATAIAGGAELSSMEKPCRPAARSTGA